MLTEDELARYIRQIDLTTLGAKGQGKLKQSSVLIVGCGGLGSIASLYLAGAGVGHIGLLDYDKVEISNLHRQIIYRTKCLGEYKVEAAREELQQINYEIKISLHQLKITTNTNIDDLIANYECVLDGTDDLAVKLLLNKACYRQKKPLFHGGVSQWGGQVTSIVPPLAELPCLACFSDNIDGGIQADNRLLEGILGPVCGLIASIQAMEVIKFIIKEKVLSGKLLLIDGKDLNFTFIQLKKNPHCSVCAEIKG
ncbi:MAG: HesA/MoeB/ThiF family protein [SAR324 cluster bacterium]|nr:HesA/MoeB/ThiF family protein [SAR324 cluster bacterium]